MTRERHTGLCRMRRRSVGALLCGLLALAAGLFPLGGCTEARTKADCDHLLNREKYDDVIRQCDNPYQRASAYLGKAGFNTFNLIESTAPAGKVAGLLGLTAANVNEKRLLVNQAIDAVKTPHGGNQAFALLLASFLGLAVTTEQFLDNGIVDAAGTVDPAKVLDDILEDTETAGALGFDEGIPPTIAIFPSLAPPFFSVVSGGVPYTLDCLADGSGLSCDSDPETLVYDDAEGSGIVLPSAAESVNKSAVIAAVAAASPAGYVLQVTAFDLGSLASVTQDPAASFLGRTDPAAAFDVGLAGYLGYLQAADAELAAAGGSTGGTDITDQIDAIVNKFDNGASCAATNPGVALIAPLLNESYAIYLQAPGTAAQPISGTPGPGAFQSSNLVSDTDMPITSLVIPLPTNTAFTLSHYKFVYPTVTGLTAFDASQATPRIDQAESAFGVRFEAIPGVAPAAAQAGDGVISFMEILCAAD